MEPQAHIPPGVIERIDVPVRLRVRQPARGARQVVRPCHALERRLDRRTITTALTRSGTASKPVQARDDDIDVFSTSSHVASGASLCWIRAFSLLSAFATYASFVEALSNSRHYVSISAPLIPGNISTICRILRVFAVLSFMYRRSIIVSVRMKPFDRMADDFFGIFANRFAMLLNFL